MSFPTKQWLNWLSMKLQVVNIISQTMDKSSSSSSSTLFLVDKKKNMYVQFNIKDKKCIYIMPIKVAAK